MKTTKIIPHETKAWLRSRFTSSGQEMDLTHPTAPNALREHDQTRQQVRTNEWSTWTLAVGRRLSNSCRRANCGNGIASLTSSTICSTFCSTLPALSGRRRGLLWHTASRLLQIHILLVYNMVLLPDNNVQHVATFSVLYDQTNTVFLNNVWSVHRYFSVFLCPWQTYQKSAPETGIQ